ncbi:conserved hypothetical protein [Vibrio parahaemolyticus AQ3810]|nr:conserved hypothetical protein [Vibrio parahaemolyticus AQ3810]EXF68580.1 hypothetical protein D030_3725 [Vibrio parahaemolyticus AQ3810]
MKNGCLYQGVLNNQQNFLQKMTCWKRCYLSDCTIYFFINLLLILLKKQSVNSLYNLDKRAKMDVDKLDEHQLFQI